MLSEILDPLISTKNIPAEPQMIGPFTTDPNFDKG
jgi:hypothetical protein